MSDKTKAELKEQVMIMNHNYQVIREMQDNGYKYFVKEIAKLEQELTKTKQALDFAVEHLNGIRGCDKNGNPQTGVISCWLDLDELGKALDQIQQITEKE